jgi:small subunit ribosomal protein S9
MVKEKAPVKKETKKPAVKKQVKQPVLASPKNTPAKLSAEKRPLQIKTAPVVKKNAEKVLVVAKSGQYTEAVGRRKTSVARVRLYKDGKNDFTVNGKMVEKYFSAKDLERIVRAPFEKIQEEGAYSVTVIVKGGGVHSQAEAIRHGLARSLLMVNEEYRKRLRGAGYLTRDSRKRERKKFGLKRARKAPQFSKR